MEAQINHRLRRAAVFASMLLMGWCVGEPSGASAQSIRDRLRDARDRAKETVRDAQQKIEESRRRCHDCGKQCMGERCNACDFKRAQEASARAIERGRQAWRDTADERRRVSDSVRAASDSVRAAAARVYQDRESIARAVAERSRQTLDRAISLAREDVARVKEILTRPEIQREAIEALDAAIVLRRQWKAAEKQIVYDGLRAVGSIQVQTRIGRMTLEDACRTRVIERFPALIGTDLADDPALVVTAVVTKDRDYFMREMKIIPSDAGPLSLLEAVEKESPFDASRTLAVLDVMQAAEDLQQAAATGDGAIDAVLDMREAILDVSKAPRH